MDGSKYRSKGYAMANAGRKLPYVFLLLVALAAGVLSIVVLQKVREQRVFAGRLQERDRQLVSVRILLQKEKAINKEMKRKVEEMKATTSSLRTQKIDQKTKLKGLETTVANLKKTQKDLEAALAEKDNRINLMEEAATNLKKARKQLEAALTEKDRHIKHMEEKTKNATNTQKELEAALSEKNSRIRQMEEKATGSNPDQMAALMEILQRKEAELEEIKTRFQDFKKPDKAEVSTPMQMNNASATPDVVLVTKATNSSSVAIPIKSEEKRSANSTAVGNAKPEEKRSANSTAVGIAKPEEKKPANTTVAESKRPIHRSLEEKPVKSTPSVEDDGIQGNLNDFDDDIYFDDIYGESRSKKSGSSRRNKEFPSNKMDKIGQPENSLDQDSDRVRYNRLLEKESTKVANKTKKNNAQGTLEKISKDNSIGAGHTASKKAVEGMTGAAGVKPNIKIPVNSDEAKQQNSKQKRKRSKSKNKKMADIAVANVGGPFAKQRTPSSWIVG
ncbi:uncharacterized protein [Miscanthus floridulus]|uniref:uncharacterized protein n=1 Tax=Miscanthus floridulus TaxID=154761 RepID=UPI003458D1F5